MDDDRVAVHREGTDEPQVGDGFVELGVQHDRQRLERLHAQVVPGLGEDGGHQATATACGSACCGGFATCSSSGTGMS